MTMKRVLVIGSPGAGKSFFGRELAAITGLPLVHLDRQYWRSGWVEPDKAVWATTVDGLIAEPQWIIDGNYTGTLAQRLARADTVIVLDLARWRCLARVITRTLRDYGRTRDDMTPGCPERFDWEFLVFVWRYRRDKRPRVMEALGSFDGTQIVLKSPTDVARYLEGIRQTVP